MTARVLGRRCMVAAAVTTLTSVPLSCPIRAASASSSVTHSRTAEPPTMTTRGAGRRLVLQRRRLPRGPAVVVVAGGDETSGGCAGGDPCPGRPLPAQGARMSVTGAAAGELSGTASNPTAMRARADNGRPSRTLHALPGTVRRRRRAPRQSIGPRRSFEERQCASGHRGFGVDHPRLPPGRLASPRRLALDEGDGNSFCVSAGVSPRTSATSMRVASRARAAAL